MHKLALLTILCGSNSWTQYYCFQEKEEEKKMEDTTSESDSEEKMPDYDENTKAFIEC